MAPRVYRLVLDVSDPLNFPPSAARSTVARESTRQWAASGAAASALALLPAGSAQEREKCLRFFRPSDAALSLGSSLLKHVAIARATGAAWSATAVTQERAVDTGKPFFAPGGVQFNASHHGDLAVLAYTGPTACDDDEDGGAGAGDEEGGVDGEEGGTGIPHVGTDVVLVDTAKGLADLRRDRAAGWVGWARIFRDAFSDGEMTVIEGGGWELQGGQGGGSGGGSGGEESTTSPQPPPPPTVEQLEADPAWLEAALRTFYAYWALKEAYIKMTSEAFMADWLRELEFRNVRVPRPAEDGDGDGDGDDDGEHGEHGDGNGSGSGRWAEGETVGDIEVWLRGRRVPRVHIEIQALGRHYMVATAASVAVDVRPVERVNVRDHVRPLAEA